MKLSTWLESERGRAKALADHLGCSKSMVSQMAGGHVRIPPNYYRLIRDFTSGVVPIEEMLPEEGAGKHSEDRATAYAGPDRRCAENDRVHIFNKQRSTDRPR